MTTIMMTLIVGYVTLIWLFLLFGMVEDWRTVLTINRLTGFLVMMSGIMGAILTFILTLPASETTTALAAALTVAITIILAAVKLLREIEEQLAEAKAI